MYVKNKYIVSFMFALLIFMAVFVAASINAYAAPVNGVAPEPTPTPVPVVTATPRPTPPSLNQLATPPAPTPTPSMVPFTTPTPRPTPPSQNQLGLNATPTPAPTGDPMIQPFIREDIEKVFTSDIEPTPPKATKDIQLSVQEAAEKAVAAAKASFRGLEITRANVVKSIEGLRNGVNMAIAALNADDRYKELIEEEDIWGDKLDEELAFELEMYKAMKYKELTSDERRELISTRDMGYDRFNFNLRKIDYNTEIMKNQLVYGAYASYSGVAKMQAGIAIQQDALELQQKNLKILQTKYELGAATRVETENAAISYDKSLLDMQRQKRSLKSLTTTFNKLIGENLDSEYQDFDRSKLEPAKKDKPVADYIKSALANRSEILIAKEELELSQRQVALYETEITNFRTLDDKQDAIQAEEEAQINYDSALQDVEADINAAYKQLTALRGVTAYYESQIKTAQGNYERIQLLYELGMTTAVSVDQVRMSLSQAKMQLENNLIDIWLQQQKLEIISGIGPGRL